MPLVQAESVRTAGIRGKAHPFPHVTRQLDSALIFAAYQLVFLRYLLAPARFLDLREMGMTLLLPSLSLYASSMNSRSFLLRLKIFLELLSAQSSNWAKVKPNTSLSADFFISSALRTQQETTFVGFIKRAPAGYGVSEHRRPQATGFRTGDTLFTAWKCMKGESCVQVSVVRAARSVR
jgi:hypothetical protein